MEIGMATPKLQLQRQAVSHKAILDFTVQRFPELPESVLRRFPELRNTAQDFERLRINLQLQLREQFVAIREMLERVSTIENLETVREAIANELKKAQQDIKNISEISEIADGVPRATAEIFGTVETDKTVEDPVVYLKTTVDDLLKDIVSGNNLAISNITNEISNLTSLVNSLIFSGVDSYTHVQNTPASVWTVTHNLGYRPSGITIWVNNKVVLSDIDYVSDDILTITFRYNNTGTVTVM